MTDSLNRDRIQPYGANPSYWQYKSRPVLLLGGSVEDNLFQIPSIREHLDLLASVGGNYVRCTMSSRDPGDVWPFERDAASGKYDLRKPGREYWRRFDEFLDLTAERDIVLQIELWDRFDFAREPWQDNPFNPKNNVNYTAGQSGLAEVITTHPGVRENAFFRTVPELENNAVVLPYQQALVDEMLSRSLRYGNILYCMDNETNESAPWGAYWARYIRRKADQAGVGVELTEMWDAHDLADPQHEQTWMHLELYSFVDISQNNHQVHQAHWDNMQAFRQKILASDCIRPINTVKTYGASTGAMARAGTGRSDSGGASSAGWRPRGFTGRRRAWDWAKQHRRTSAAPGCWSMRWMSSRAGRETTCWTPAAATKPTVWRTRASNTRSTSRMAATCCWTYPHARTGC